MEIKSYIDSNPHIVEFGDFNTPLSPREAIQTKISKKS
jgi:hypothetical protein